MVEQLELGKLQCPIIFCVTCLHDLQVDSPPPPPISPTLQTKLNALISAHQYNASQLAKEYVEPRTRNISAYAVHSGLSKRVVRLLALDDIALNYNDELVKLLAKKEFVHNLTNTAECHSGTICVCVCSLFLFYIDDPLPNIQCCARSGCYNNFVNYIYM